MYLYLHVYGYVYIVYLYRVGPWWVERRRERWRCAGRRVAGWLAVRGRACVSEARQRMGNYCYWFRVERGGDRERIPVQLTRVSCVHHANIDSMYSADDLKELFAKFGEVGDVYIPKSRASNESRGFAFIRYVNKEDAEKAIAEMEGYEHEGRQLHVQYAKQRRPENPREFYRERERGRGGYDDRRGGYEDRRGGYDDRRGGADRYEDRRGGGYDRGYAEDRYDDRGRGRYDDRRRSRSGDRRDRSRSRGGRRSRSPRRGASPPRRD